MKQKQWEKDQVYRLPWSGFPANAIVYKHWHNVFFYSFSSERWNAKEMSEKQLEMIAEHFQQSCEMPWIQSISSEAGDHCPQKRCWLSGSTPILTFSWTKGHRLAFIKALSSDAWK